MDRIGAIGAHLRAARLVLQKIARDLEHVAISQGLIAGTASGQADKDLLSQIFGLGVISKPSQKERHERRPQPPIKARELGGQGRHRECGVWGHLKFKRARLRDARARGASAAD